jgi:hypothetical protein
LISSRHDQQLEIFVMPVRIELSSKYNPSIVLSSALNRDEYDSLFSSKGSSSSLSFLDTTLVNLKDIASSFVDIFLGNPLIDPGRIGELQRVGTMYAAGFQSSLGIAKVFTGDIYSGVYNLLLGVLGVSCSREGKNREMLKTYVVISFINGCVQAMEVLQISLVGIPLFGHGVPLLVSGAHVITLLNPVASFIGAYLGWQYIRAAKQQYMLALANYHLQMLLMQQHQQMMGQASQLQALDPELKRLPAIEEEVEDEAIIECTGGTESSNH